MQTRPSLAGDELSAVPHPSDVAADALAKRDAWPRPPMHVRLGRRMLGQPETSPLDEGAMRADADKIGKRLGQDAHAGAIPGAEPGAGLLGLAARSEERIVRGARRLVRDLARVVARATASQAGLDRDQGGLDDAGREVSRAQDDVPPRPVLGLVLTGRLWHLASLVLLLVPLEAYLTFPALEILGLSDRATRWLCVLIGAGLALAAEACGMLIAYIAQPPAQDDPGPGRSRLVATAAVLVVATVGVALWTLGALTASREHNLQIADGQRAATQATQAATSPQGFSGLSTPSASGPAVAGSGGFAASPATPASAAQPDLRWTFALQLLAFLTGTILAMRTHLAAPHREAMRRVRLTLRRVRRLEGRVRAAEARDARRSGPLDAAERHLRLHVQAERARLEQLFDRARERYDEQLDDAANAPTMTIPDVPPVEDVISGLTTPPRAALAQPVVANVPTGRPPAPPPALPTESPDDPATEEMPVVPVDASAEPAPTAPPPTSHPLPSNSVDAPTWPAPSRAALSDPDPADQEPTTEASKIPRSELDDPPASAEAAQPVSELDEPAPHPAGFQLASLLLGNAPESRNGSVPPPRPVTDERRPR